MASVVYDGQRIDRMEQEARWWVEHNFELVASEPGVQFVLDRHDGWRVTVNANGSSTLTKHADPACAQPAGVV